MSHISYIGPSHSAFEKIKSLGAWSTILFCFSIACLGTAATTVFSTVAIILCLATLKCTEYPKILKNHPFTLIALLLFIYLGMSLLWSNHLTEGLSIWKKYREFIFIPVFLIYFSNNKLRQHSLIALYTGMSVTLIISYLVHFNLFPFELRQHSINNRIFNGLLLSFFAYWSLTLAMKYKKYRLLFISLFAASFFIVFFIRDGRTGYTLFIALVLLFFFQNWKWKGLLSALCLFSLFYLILYIHFSHTLQTSLWHQSNLSEIDLGNDSFSINYLANLDIRLEYYINTIRIILNNWIFGIGIGDFSSLYVTTSIEHEHFWPPTANAHNEFLMITAQSGIIGLSLFLLFFFYLFKSAYKLPTAQTQHAIAVIITIGISCSFNSSFLDSQDGVLLLLLISLFFSHPSETAHSQ